jgi:hypothetical protein
MDTSPEAHFNLGEQHLKAADRMASVDFEAAVSYGVLARAHFDAARTAKALGLDVPAEAPEAPKGPLARPNSSGPFFSWMDNGGIGDD